MKNDIKHFREINSQKQLQWVLDRHSLQLLKTLKKFYHNDVLTQNVIANWNIMCQKFAQNRRSLILINQKKIELREQIEHMKWKLNNLQVHNFSFESLNVQKSFYSNSKKEVVFSLDFKSRKTQKIDEFDKLKRTSKYFKSFILTNEVNFFMKIENFKCKTNSKLTKIDDHQSLNKFALFYFEQTKKSTNIWMLNVAMILMYLRFLETFSTFWTRSSKTLTVNAMLELLTTSFEWNLSKSSSTFTSNSFFWSINSKIVSRKSKWKIWKIKSSQHWDALLRITISFDFWKNTKIICKLRTSDSKIFVSYLNLFSAKTLKKKTIASIKASWKSSKLCHEHCLLQLRRKSIWKIKL